MFPKIPATWVFAKDFHNATAEEGKLANAFLFLVLVVAAFDLGFPRNPNIERHGDRASTLEKSRKVAEVVQRVNSGRLRV